MFTLRKTCGRAPEVYEVRTAEGELVGEIRTRWGDTTVHCPDMGLNSLELLHTTDHTGVHAIGAEDFDYVIRLCLGAVQDWIAAGRPTELVRPPAPDVAYVVEDR